MRYKKLKFLAFSATALGATLAILQIGSFAGSPGLSYNDYPQCLIAFDNGVELANIPLADTPARARKGLSKNPVPKGMLFVWAVGESYAFWMKDTPEPLDIAFVKKESVITDIFSMSPYDLTLHESSQPTTMALEMPQGFFNDHGISTSTGIVSVDCF